MTDSAAAAQVAAQIAVLDTKLDGLIEDVGEVKELAQHTNGRVRSLERWRAASKGALAVLGLCGPVATGVIVWLITGSPGA